MFEFEKLYFNNGGNLEIVLDWWCVCVWLRKNDEKFPSILPEEIKYVTDNWQTIQLQLTAFQEYFVGNILCRCRYNTHTLHTHNIIYNILTYNTI